MNENEETTVVTEKKSFVQRHKVAITVVATSTFWIAMNRLALKDHNNFLKDKGLYDEFYNPEDPE